MRWRIFPCHSIVQADRGPACSCGKADCGSPGKHPRTRGGFKDATDDPAQIKRWWTRWADANIALATGSGLVVIDIDGQEGSNEFKALVAANGPPPETLLAQTGRGHHLVYATRPDSPEVRSSARGHVHVRGEGGYIIVAPSSHISGHEYKWLHKKPVALLPEWLRQWSQGYEITNKTAGRQGFDHLGAMPAYLQGSQRDISQQLNESLKAAWSIPEEMRLKSALSAIDVKACGYEDFLRVGMALKELDWERSDGTSISFDIWDEWCQRSEHYNQAGLEFKWKSFRRTGVTVGTVYHLAQQHGWNGGAPLPQNLGSAGLASSPVGEKPSGLNGHHAGPAALPAAFGGLKPIFFPDMTEEGKIRSTMLNAKVAIAALGLECRYDLFHNRMLVAGELINKWNSSELSDHVTTMVRDIIRYRFGFDPNKTNVQDACEALCLARRFDPVLDYLDSLRWDGQPRLDRWMSQYLGAADNDLNRAIGRLSLLAAVRRARRPGAKFDQIIVLEGPQGQGKSEALEILAGPENFSDQSILGVDDRKQQELTEGVWLYEIGELSGLRRAEIEHVKAFASRKVDRARPAYGRYSVSQPRRTVFFASTNRDDYLQDETGNRRFWPVAVGRIDLAGLRRDRDQLWAETTMREAAGESHFLPESLWKAAGDVQESRKIYDEWTEAIGQYVTLKNRNEVSITEVLTDNQFLQLRAGDIGQKEQSRAARVLRDLDFVRYQKRTAEGKRIWRYRRPSP
jgi:hypothetical protein